MRVVGNPKVYSIYQELRTKLLDRIRNKLEYYDNEEVTSIDARVKLKFEKIIESSLDELLKEEEESEPEQDRNATLPAPYRSVIDTGYSLMPSVREQTDMSARVSSEQLGMETLAETNEDIAGIPQGQSSFDLLGTLDFNDITMERNNEGPPLFTCLEEYPQ